MFARLLIIAMLVLFPLQWGVAQAHEAGDELQSLWSPAPAGPAYTAAQAHSREPGGVCQFDPLAHTAGVCIAEDAAGALQPLLRERPRATAAAFHLQSVPADIERPKWSRHGSIRGGPPI
ncbi:MAG: hypothetical protein V4505_10700 [Pseudomonadota bacterium]